MAMHLFSTPVECTQCGTVVSDPTVDRCPNCSALLRERRTPHRVAGVEQRYGSLRILLSVLRFFGIITVAVGLLVFFLGTGSGTGELPPMAGLSILLGSILSAISLFAVEAMFRVLIDIEENTRASFRVQQMLLDAAQGKQPRAQATPSVAETTS